MAESADPPSKGPFRLKTENGIGASLPRLIQKPSKRKSSLGKTQERTFVPLRQGKLRGGKKPPDRRVRGQSSLD